MMKTILFILFAAISLGIHSQAFSCGYAQNGCETDKNCCPNCTCDSSSHKCGGQNCSGP